MTSPKSNTYKSGVVITSGTKKKDDKLIIPKA